MPQRVPEIEIADHADGLGIRRQHHERHAIDAIERHRMRAELVVDSPVGAFAQQIEIEVAEHGREAVGIVEIDDVEVGLDVFACLGKFADVIGEKRQRLRVAVRTTMFMKLAPLLDFPRRALVFRVGIDPLENFAIALAGGKLFAQKEVRQALLYALNRQQIVTAVFFGHGSVANSVEPPTSWAYKDKPKVLYTFDKAKAGQLLDGAGWAMGADGIRAKDGVKLKFQMDTNAGNKQRESMLTIMQQSWKDIGVDATPNLIQFPQLVTEIVDTRKFDMFLVGFNWTVDPDEAPLYHSRNTAPGGFNGAFFKNQQVDGILDQALGTLDKNKRKELYGQFQDIMSDEVPSPVILFNHGIWAWNKRVQGTDFGPFNQFGERPWSNKVFVTDGK